MEVKDTGYCKTKKEMQSLPNNLLFFRQQANISQDKLAEAVDCSRRTIGYIEKGMHALCREVASKPMEENSLKLLLEPQNLGGKTPYFGIVRTAAEQLQLINTKENTISLAVDKDVVKNMDSMRHYINMHLEIVSDSLFYKVTKTFNYGFSNAIRMLNDLGVIKAEHRLDAKEIWSMHPCEGHDLDSTVTHITIGGQV